MQQTAQTDAEGRPKSATAAQRDGKRSRWFRMLFAVAAVTLLLELWMVRDYRIWRGPNYGVLIEARGDLLWEAIYRTDTQSLNAASGGCMTK